jgi:hypothetical protein
MKHKCLAGFLLGFSMCSHAQFENSLPLKDFAFTPSQIDSLEILTQESRNHLDLEDMNLKNEINFGGDNTHTIKFNDDEFKTNLTFGHNDSDLTTKELYITEITHLNNKIYSISLKSPPRKWDFSLTFIHDTPFKDEIGDMELLINGAKFQYIIAIDKSWTVKSAKKYSFVDENIKLENDTYEVPESAKVNIPYSLDFKPDSSISSKSVNGWTVKYPLNPENAVKLNHSVQILWLVHPSIAKVMRDYKFRSRYPIPVLKDIQNIFVNEKFVTGEAPNFIPFIYSTAYEKVPASGGNFNSRYAYSLPPSDVCGSSCPTDYKTILERMSNSPQLREMRRQWKADVVMFVHLSYDSTSQYAGLALTPYGYGDYRNKHTGFAVAGWGINPNPNLYYPQHELMHILGAGHSRYNDVPGKSYARAFIGSYKDSNGSVEAVRSFMAYDNICKETIKTSYCTVFPYLSSPSRLVDDYEKKKKIRLGAGRENNKKAVALYLREVSQYSDSI